MVRATVVADGLADRLLRLWIVIPTALLFIFTTGDRHNGFRWLNYAAGLLLLLLFFLWVLVRLERKNDDTGLLP
jgi:hypothetical protein